ncbi:MAG: peptidoglycan-binding protein [Oricola sp.]|jgi:hypothetical protein|nr:peptidoglycan-binding protein [Oricola sp.]
MLRRRGSRVQFGDDDDKGSGATKPRRRQAQGAWSLFWFLLFVLAMAVVLFLFFFINRTSGQTYSFLRTFVCTTILKNDCESAQGPTGIDRHEILNGEPILVDGKALPTWLEYLPEGFVLANKIQALNLNYSVLGGSPFVRLNSGNVFIGLYEERLPHIRRLQSGGQDSAVEAGVHFLLAGANGDFDARELYRDLKLDIAQQNAAHRAFYDLHVMNGAEGYYRLGQIYLWNPAMEPLNTRYPVDHPPLFIDHADHYNNDFLTATPMFEQAYKAMHKAVLCNHTYALRWRSYISTQAGFSRTTEINLETAAEAELNKIASETINGISDHCEGETFRQRINQLVDPAVIHRFVVDRRAWPSVQELVDKLSLPEPEFDRWIGVLIRESFDVYGFNADYRVAPYGASSQSGFNGRQQPGSQYYRQSPGADVTDDDEPGAEERRSNLVCADASAASLAAGDAYLRNGDTREAQRYYQQALTEGRRCAAPATVKAQKRLNALNLACEYDTDSLNRIARDADQGESVEDGGGAVIKLRARQQALRAHGYYAGNIDGRYGAGTRDAVGQFQDDFGFDRTGNLTPIETVYLICSAATVKDDTASKTTLGVMYLTGLGVLQNTDAGMRFLSEAAQSRDADALFNLATIFGLGTVTSSYKLCGVPENLARADAYLEEAAALGHPLANRLIDKYQNEAPSERWRKYESDLKDGFFKDRLVNTPAGCAPNP